MDDPTEQLRLERDRLVKRLARERSARAQAEAIAERATRDLAASLEETQRHAEVSLRESEARTQAILDATIDAIITIDEKGIIQSANPATETIFGYGEDELLGRNVSMLMPRPHREHHDRYLRAYLETGKAKVIGIGRETIGRRKDGSTLPIDLAVGEVHGQGHRLFTGIVRDVTARKAAQIRLEDTLLDLRKSRDDLLNTLNQLRIGTLIIDGDDRVNFLSETCGCLEGVDPASSVGMRWDEVLPLDKTSRDTLREMMRRDQGARARLSLNWSVPSGTRYWVETDIKDDPRDPTTRIVFLYDVSEVHELRSKLTSSSHGQMTGTSAPMRAVYEQISEIAGGDWTVLIQGETGVGKELVSRAVHAASPRKSGPFIAVNCAGLTDSLLESQLFGHRKGAFTGAVTDQQGLFEAAAGGTILLDEIGDVSMKVQTSLLRVIQEREVLRVGDSQVRRVDVRVLVATNRDLSQEVAAGRFREDLLYRIRVARIAVPPLRERAEDIPLLVGSFLAQQRLSTGRPVMEVEDVAMTALQSYTWPGNVRELKSAIEHAVIRCKGSVICLRDLPPELRGEGEHVCASATATAV
ncbi:MAG: sigma 54-interacting transcriptional regulator, partial [Deltaproteobacteria bacterium]|nr:sigma 54-interacting transcriptional regulator [Deltaproteobacteria bacterium]